MNFPQSPGWFLKAIAMEPEEHTIDVDGCSTHYLSWGDPDLPGLVFVHGGAAHAHWWSHLAPLFTERWHVVALDLSGHGDSGRRSEYSREAWSHEVMAVAADAGFPGPPVVVGHSLGGMVIIETAAAFGSDLAGAVIVDTPVRRPDPESEQAARGQAFVSPGSYPDLETALSRFRLIPPQPCENAFIVDFIARKSLHETPGGWTWKFDPRIFSQAYRPLGERLQAIKTRVALFRGEFSVIVPPDIAEHMYDLMGRSAPVVSIPEAHHHLILDQPLAFVAALRTLLADWEHSIPRRG
ncbi:MAG: alpha/beta fold hydrolase [Gammaproteobacteria bacterium]|nr:alpha/beta fold hydrolase [Gammaproteobacteria bacterium]